MRLIKSVAPAAVYANNFVIFLDILPNIRLTTTIRNPKLGKRSSKGFSASLASPHGLVKNSGTTLGRLLHNKAVAPTIPRIIKIDRE